MCCLSVRIHTLDPDPPVRGPVGLKMYPMIGDDPPTRFAWQTAVGIKFGRVDTSATDAYKMTVDDKLLGYCPHFVLGKENGRVTL